MAQRQRDAGFTLIEIMVVIVIIGLIAGMVAMNSMRQAGSARVQTARADVATLYGAASTYRIENGTWPESLEALITPDPTTGATFLIGHKSAPKDPWGREYLLRPGNNKYAWEVVCLGEDGEEGTNDDIVSSSLKDG